MKIDDFEEQEAILISLRLIAQATDIHSKKVQKESGLTIPQLIVLREVHLRENLTLRKLASFVSLSPATVSNICDRLFENGYLGRIKGTKDKRSVSLSLTEKGYESLQNSPSLLQEKFLNHYRLLKSWEKKLIVSTLERIADMMGPSKETLYTPS